MFCSQVGRTQGGDKKMFRTYHFSLIFKFTYCNFGNIFIFNPSHSNSFADYENDLTITPLFCQQEVPRGVPPPPPPPPTHTHSIATTLQVESELQ